MTDQQKIEWVEVYIECKHLKYCLILQYTNNKKHQIVDVKKSRKVIAEFELYQDATAWLNEDGFCIVDTRYNSIL